MVTPHPAPIRHAAGKTHNTLRRKLWRDMKASGMQFLAMVLLCAIICRCIYVGIKSRSYMDRLICVGIAAMLLFQVLINIGMCLSILPVIGITLPFLSCGGTSVATLYLGIGLALSVYMHNRTTLFS